MPLSDKSVQTPCFAENASETFQCYIDPNLARESKSVEENISRILGLGQDQAREIYFGLSRRLGLKTPENLDELTETGIEKLQLPNPIVKKAIKPPSAATGEIEQIPYTPLDLTLNELLLLPDHTKSGYLEKLNSIFLELNDDISNVSQEFHKMLQDISTKISCIEGGFFPNIAFISFGRFVELGTLMFRRSLDLIDINLGHKIIIQANNTLLDNIINLIKMKISLYNYHLETNKLLGDETHGRSEITNLQECFEIYEFTEIKDCLMRARHSRNTSNPFQKFLYDQGGLIGVDGFEEGKRLIDTYTNKLENFRKIFLEIKGVFAEFDATSEALFNNMAFQ